MCPLSCALRIKEAQCFSAEMANTRRHSDQSHKKTARGLATRGRLNGHKILSAQTKKSFLHGITRRLDVSRDFLGVTDKNTLKALDCTWDDFFRCHGRVQQVNAEGGILLGHFYLTPKLSWAKMEKTLRQLTQSASREEETSEGAVGGDEENQGQRTNQQNRSLQERLGAKEKVIEGRYIHDDRA